MKPSIETDSYQNEPYCMKSLLVIQVLIEDNTNDVLFLSLVNSS